MNTIYFKFTDDGQSKISDDPRGNLAVGEHSIDSEKTVLLSPECSSMFDLRAQAVRLKAEIDAALLLAEGRLPQ